MEKTISGRRKYDKDDIEQAAQMLACIEETDNTAAIFSERQIKQAMKMLQDIAAGMNESDRVVCDGEITEMEQI